MCTISTFTKRFATGGHPVSVPSKRAVPRDRGRVTVPLSSFVVLWGFLFTPSSGINAQDLHVHYDYGLQSIIYVSDGDTLDRPVVRHDADVLFHLGNVNTFRYDVEVEKREESAGIIGSGGGTGITSFLPGENLPGLGNLTGGLSDLLGGAGKLLQQLGITGGGSGGGPTFGFAGGGNEYSEEEAEAAQRLSEILAVMADREEQMVSLTEDIRLQLQQREYVALAKRELKYIKHHPALSPQQVLRLSEEYIEKAVGQSVAKAEDFRALEAADRENRKLENKLRQLELEQQGYGRQLEALNQLRDQMRQGELGTSKGLVETLESAVATGEVLLETQAKNRDKIQQTLAESRSYTRDLIDLRYEIELLRNHNFTYLERFSVGGGSFVLQPKVFPLDSNGARVNVSPRLLTPVEVKVKGGLKITSTVGLSIGQFLDAPQDFSVRDGHVVGTDKDRFSPIVNTFFHIHPHTGGRAVLGGSLGVGIPLGNAGGTQSATFLLGPSLVFGDRDLVVITAGLMGGQVERLGGGLAVGDPFTATDGVLPLQRRYELGYFVSLSFQLFGK